MAERVKDDLYEPDIQPRYSPFKGKDTREPEWADYGRAVGVGVQNIRSATGAATRFIGEQTDNPMLVRKGRERQTLAREATEETMGAMTPQARARIEAALGDEEFMNDIVSSLGLKITASAPSVVAVAVPATLFSGALATTAAVAAGGAALNTAMFADELYAQTDALSDQELQKQSAAYAKLREAKDEEQAREEFNGIVRGLMPVYVAAATALTSALGPAGQLARAGRGAGASLTHGGIKAGILEGGASEYIEEGSQAYGAELAKVRTGQNPQLDQRAVDVRALEGLVLGATMGGGVSALPGGSRNVRRPVDNTGQLPSAQTKPVTEPEVAQTAQPSTAPAVPAPALSPNSNPKTAATPAAPSVATPATVPVAPRKRPPREALGVKPTIAPVIVGKQPTPDVPEGTASPAATNQLIERTNAIGVDAAVSAALAPNTPPVASAPAQAAPVQSTPRARPARPAAGPPGTVPTAFGPATVPTPIQTDAAVQQVTPRGNVVPPELPPAGTEPALRAASPVSGPPPSGAAVRAPRILADVRPEAVEMARDDAFQQNEAVRANLAAMRAEERGPAGRTDLYGKRGEKRRADATAAKTLFEATVPAETVIPDAKNVDARTALKRRLDDTLAAAKEGGITIPTRIDYDGTAPTADHLVWLREVADMRKAFDAKTPPSPERIGTFLLRERAAKSGDFELMKSERRAEGDQAKRGAQADVETIADTKTIAAAIDSADDTTAAPVASAASAEADAVPTVASKTKRGAVRDAKSEDKAASAVRKIELTPEEKAAYAAKLLGQQQTKATLSGRVVDDAKFTKEVAKKAAAPVEEVPPKVTPKVEPPKAVTVRAKVAAAAKRVERKPSQAKIDANNFTKGHVSIQGLPVTIETARGEVREGTTRGGKKWSVKMPAHYGEIKRTEGADGDGVDVYIGPKPDSDFVAVLDQLDPTTGAFDEHKAFIGYVNMRGVLEDYVASFSDGRGPQRLGEFKTMTMAEFKEWLKGDTKSPTGDPAVQAEAEQDAMSTPEGWAEAETAPAVELSDYDVRSDGPTIDGTKHRSVASYTASEALDEYVTPQTTRGLPGVMFPFLKRRLQVALERSGTQVHFVTDAVFNDMYYRDGSTAAGFYDAAMNHVIIRNHLRQLDDAYVSHVVMHELAHAATVGKLDEERFGPGRDTLSTNRGSATYQLTALFLDVKKEILTRGESMTDLWGTYTPERIYALKNIREFVAEALSNPAFQDILAKVNVSSDTAMFLNLGQHQKVSFWRALVETIRKALGMPPGTYSALEGVLSLSERLMYGSRQPIMEARYLGRLAGNREPVARQTFAERLLARRRTATVMEENAAEVEGMTGMRMQDAFELNLKRLADRTAGSRSLGDPKWLRMRSMTDMATLAKSYFKGNEVRRVVNAIESIRVTGNEIAREAEPVLNDLINAQRKYKGTPAFEELVSVMHDATMSGAHPDRDLAANVQLGKKSMRGAWGRAQHTELQARYNALPDDLKALYQSSLKYFQDQHNAMIRQSLENRVLKALGFNDPGLADRIFNGTETDADKELLGDLYEVVSETTEFKKVTGPYFPLKRFGNFVVRGSYDMQMPTTAHRQIDENTFEFDTQKAAEDFVAQSKNHAALSSVYVDEATGSLYFIDDDGKQVRVHKDDVDAVRRWRVRVQNKHLEFFENRADAEARKAELDQEGVKTEAVVARRDDPRQATGDLLSTHMERLMRRVEQRDKFKEMSEYQQNEVRRAIEEASYAALASTRIQTSRIQRRYVEGASKDIVRSTAEYAGSMSGYLARYRHQGELDAAIKEMNKEADTSGEPNTAMGRSTIRNEIMYRINQPNIAPSQHNTRWDQWRHRLLVTSFIGHLASPAYSLINATQPAMVTAPVLGARHGIGSTVAALTKAYSDMAAVRTAAAGVINTARRAGNAQADTNTYVGDLLDRLSNANEKAMIGYLIKHGAIDADAGLEVSKLVDQSRGDQWLSYFEGISRQLPLAVESINRFASALAAYRLELKRNGGDHEAAKLYAQEIVESTQGIYASTNVPPVFSSPIASIIFQFKKYGHLIYSLLGQQIGKAVRNTNPGDRAEAIKALAFIVGAHATMAGTVGLPTEGIKLMLMGANLLGLTGLTMEDFEEWERELAQSMFGDTAAEMITHGVLRGLPGGLSMDLSQRMGMQSYMTFGAPDSSEEGDIWSFIGETVAGAPGGMLIDMTQGANKVANGDVLKGMEQLVPVKVIKDGLKAYQLATEGKITKSGRKAMEPLTMPEAAMRLFGITPGRAAESQLASSSYYRNTGRTREQRLQFLYQWADAKPRERQKLWREIQEWNRDQPQANRLSYSTLGDYVRRRREEEKGPSVGGMRVTERDKAVYERVQRLYNQ